MVDTDKLNSCKIEVRSLLLSYQKGCDLQDFNKAYFGLIGKRLPFREMGFNTEIEFLYSMPDAVKITPAGRNIYHLMGVADEKSKHIQKMVAKQKPSKLKSHPLPVRTYRSSRFTLPPRFDKKTETRRIEDISLRSRTYHKVSEYTPVTVTKEEPKWHSNVSRTYFKESENPPITLTKEEPKLPSNASPMEEVIALVKNLKGMLAMDDLICEYKRMYNKSLSLSTYGFSSVKECISEIPELVIVQNNNVEFVRLRSEKDFFSKSDKKDESSSRIPLLETPSSKVTLLETPPSNNSENTCKQNCDSEIIPVSLRAKLLKVAVRCTDGILASDFLRCFEEVTGRPLELVNLGYRCLNDFIDDYPDIFVRTPIAGSRKDFLIYSAKNFKSGQKETVDNETLIRRIALNLRRILEAYPEGIKLEELTCVYNINYKDSFHIQDCGFEDLETFLLTIKNDVPLRFSSINGVKSIHLVKFTEKPDDSPCMVPEVCDREAIPCDAAFPEFKYKPHTFPADFDYSVFIPAYTSSVTHAGHLYLQLQENFGSSDDLTKLGTELDNFYYGSQSKQYMMKPIHIKLGASCVAMWPADKHWYRAQILSIPSMQDVKVIYVDYGTTDTIPKFLLRYAKSDFINLPVQAIRCRLAFLKPPNNAPKWDINTRNRILKLCQDIPLMAKIEEMGPNGVYSVILCDTNGKDDVYINDVLIEEELAEPAESNLLVPEPKMRTEVPPSLHPLQALQAQYYLQAFATVAPVFAQNKLYLGLLKEVTAYCQNSDPVSQNTSMQLMPPIGPPGFSTIPQGVNSFANSSALFNTYSSAASSVATNTVRKTGVNTIPPPKDFYSPSVALPSSSLSSSPEMFAEENKDAENELFDEDFDDEDFQQFMQKVSSTNARHVKRAKLGDGYQLHIIVIDSEPHVSSGEISKLIFNNKNEDFLLTKLQESDIPIISLSEDGNEQLFQDLLKFKVKGVQETKGLKSSIVLHPLRCVMTMLNMFGHPSVTLRTKLIEELASFNPNDQYWTENVELSDPVQSESEDGLSGATDDDKIEKLCLYDLLALKEIFGCKKKTLSCSDMTKNSDECDKIERFLQKVLNRIQEIQEICKVFS